MDQKIMFLIHDTKCIDVTKPFSNIISNRNIIGRVEIFYLGISISTLSLEIHKLFCWYSRSTKSFEVDTETLLVHISGTTFPPLQYA